jgi:hypothetical protein
MEGPQELAFDSAGYLYVGHGRDSSGLSIYRIPPGGGTAEEYGGGAFVDPDGLDVDSADTVWVASGLTPEVEDGEVMRVAPNGQVSLAGSDYLANPTALEIDRIGRFGPVGTLLVGDRGNSANARIVAVSPTGAHLVVLDGGHVSIRDLCFDEEGTVWFISARGGDVDGELYKWPVGGVPTQVVVTGATGDVLGLCYDSHRRTLVLGLRDERRVVRLSSGGQVVEQLARDIDPRSFAVDAVGNVYVSDVARDVIWQILPAVVHVDDDNTTGVEDGTERYPYNSIQEGVDAVADGGAVKVARGTYRENLTIAGKSMTIRGGYLGGRYPGTGDFGEASRDPDPSTNQTVIEGGGSATQIACQDDDARGSVLTSFKLINGGAIFRGGLVLKGVVATSSQ